MSLANLQNPEIILNFTSAVGAWQLPPPQKKGNATQRTTNISSMCFVSLSACILLPLLLQMLLFLLLSSLLLLLLVKSLVDLIMLYFIHRLYIGLLIAMISCIGLAF